MKEYSFIDFGTSLDNMRTGVDNEIASLMRTFGVERVEFDENEVTIQTNDSIEDLAAVVYETLPNTFNISLELQDGTSLDLTDISLDDMIMVYTNLHIALKEK